MNKLILSLMIFGLGISVNCYGFHSENLEPMADDHNRTPLYALNNQIVIHKKSEWTDKSKHMVNFKETSPLKYFTLRLQFTHPCLYHALNIVESVSTTAIMGTGVGMVLYHNNTDFRNGVQGYVKYLSLINSGYIKPYSEKAFDYVKLYPKASAITCGALLLYYKSQKFRKAVQRVFGACFNPALNHVKSVKERSVNKIKVCSNSVLNRIMDFPNKFFSYVCDKVHKCFSVTFNSVKFLF